MPHQCTNCGHTFADGSKEMLSGCPDCGGTKFQFHPDAAPDEPTDEEPPDRDAGAVGRAADAVRSFVSTDEPDEGESDLAAGVGVNADDAGEDPAQASARSDVVDAADLPPAEDRDPPDDPAPGADAGSPDDPVPETDAGPSEPDTDPTERDAPDESETPDESPDISELREELNAQFESIRIVEPGQYELNLMELYDREEYIIALQENGRYVIEVADSWREGEGGDR